MIKTGYAYSIIGIVEQRKELTPLYNGFSKNAAEERITANMKYKKSSVAAIALTALLAVGTITAFAASAADVQETYIPAPLENDSIIDKEITQQAVSDSEKQFIWPVENCFWVTSWFGELKELGWNIDFITISGSDAAGSAIYAVADGVVCLSDYDEANGNYLIIDHQDGLQTVYSHCETIEVQSGDVVEQGSTIATLGKSGKVTGYCMTLTVYENGVACDPILYFPDAIIDSLAYAK